MVLWGCLRGGKLVATTVLGIILVFKPVSPVVDLELQRQVDRNAANLGALDDRVARLEAMDMQSHIVRIETTVEYDHRIIFGLAVLFVMTGLESALRVARRLKTRVSDEQKKGEDE